MYSVRKQASDEIISLHIENEHGRQQAIEEALMRTHFSGRPHIALDDNSGAQLYPGPIRVEPASRQWARGLIERYFNR